MILLKYLSFFLGLPMIQSLTCNEVLEMPTTKMLTLQELSSMSPKNINHCLPHLAREPMELPNAKYIWKTLIEYYEGIPNIPESILAQLHWVTVAITPEEYTNITIASIDTVSNFGLPYNMDCAQLEAIAERVRQDFAGKTPEDYTYYDLKALNQILCAFNRSEIESIHPAAYRESAAYIGKLKCPADVMTGFATLAVHEDGFGPLDKWTGKILKTVGNVSEYIPGYVTNELKNESNAVKGVIEEDSEDNMQTYNKVNEESV